MYNERWFSRAVTADAVLDGTQGIWCVLRVDGVGSGVGCNVEVVHASELSVRPPRSRARGDRWAVVKLVSHAAPSATLEHVQSVGTLLSFDCRSKTQQLH